MTDWRRFDGYDSPNYTPIPNQFLEDHLAELSGAETKVLLYIMRRTLGWHQESDAISLTQIVGGIVTADGRRIDKGTGLAMSTVEVTLKSLESKRLIVVERDPHAPATHRSNRYSLHVAADDPPDDDDDDDGPDELPPGSPPGSPPGGPDYSENRSRAGPKIIPGLGRKSAQGYTENRCRATPKIDVELHRKSVIQKKTNQKKTNQKKYGQARLDVAVQKSLDLTGLSPTEPTVSSLQKLFAAYPDLDAAQQVETCVAWHTERGTKVGSWLGLLRAWFKGSRAGPPDHAPVLDAETCRRNHDRQMQGWGTSDYIMGEGFFGLRGVAPPPENGHHPESGVPLWDRCRLWLEHLSEHNLLPQRAPSDLAFETFRPRRQEGDALVLDATGVHEYDRATYATTIERVADQCWNEHVEVKWEEAHE